MNDSYIIWFIDDFSGVHDTCYEDISTVYDNVKLALRTIKEQYSFIHSANTIATRANFYKLYQLCVYAGTAIYLCNLSTCINLAMTLETIVARIP